MSELGRRHRTASSSNVQIWSARSPEPDLGNSARLRRIVTLLERSGVKGALLDLGCGAAALAPSCQRLGLRLTGIEIIPSLAALAQKRVNVVVSDVGEQHLPFRSEAFDAVVAGEIIEHVVDTSSFLAEIRRVLQPGGVAVITTPNLASFENRVRLLLGRYPLWVDYASETGEGHVRAYTPRVLRRHLGDMGFEVVAMLGNWVPFVPQRFMDDVRHPWISWTGVRWPSLAMNIAVLARRLPSGGDTSAENLPHAHSRSGR